MNLYGYANGDPVNYSDPFGLCPYAGEKRTTNVESCPKDARRDAFRMLANDAGPEGKETIRTFADNAMNLALTSGSISCAGIQTSECTSKAGVRIDGDRGASLVAADAVHAASHVNAPAGTLSGHEEIRAWDRSLNFYERLPASSQTGKSENIASKMRATNRAEYESHLCRGKQC